jgi:hypothetical protein
VTVVADDDLVQHLNRWFDGLPRERIVIGGGDAPAFRALGVAGFHVGLVVMLLAAVARGYPMWVGLGVAAAAGLSFFGWSLLRRLVTGSETIVLFEHVWVAGLIVAGFLWWVDEPIIGWLDVFAAGLCIFLAFGRLGCAVAGCCHGHPSAVGITYHRSGEQAHRLAGIRLFPVQLVEAAGLAMLGVLALALVPATAEGRVLAVVLAIYGVMRFGTEALRGDPRPVVFGVPVARAAAATQVTVAVVVDQTIRGTDPDIAPMIVVAAILATSALVGTRWMRRRPRLGAHQVVALRAILAESEPNGRHGDVSTDVIEPGVVVGTSWEGDQCHVSVSADGVSSAALAHLLRSAVGPGSAILQSSSGVVHAVVGPPSEPPEAVGKIRTAYFRHAEG